MTEVKTQHVTSEIVVRQRHLRETFGELNNTFKRIRDVEDDSLASMISGVNQLEKTKRL